MPLKTLILGYGVRGRAYCQYALAHPDEYTLAGIAEKGDVPSVPGCAVYGDWEEAIAAENGAEAVIIALPDALHKPAALAALAKGLHVLLEKPVGCSWKECEEIRAAREKSGTLVLTGYVLRYSPYYKELQKVLRSQVAGDITSIHHLVAIGYAKSSHAFCRGNWAREEDGTGTLVQKCSHDFDLIVWWTLSRELKRIASYGSLAHWRPENRPAGAAARCIECPARARCPFDAVRLYVENDSLRYHFADGSDEAMRKLVESSRYGKCVYLGENDAVDHQTTLMEFEGGLTVTLEMESYSKERRRVTHFYGTRAEIVADGETITVKPFLGEDEVVKPECRGGHGGGDIEIMATFHRLATRASPERYRSLLDSALESHMLAFRAEECRKARPVARGKRDALPLELPVLHEITKVLVREKNVRSLLETVLDILHRRLGMLRGTFTLLEGDELKIEASTEELNAEEKSLGRYRVGEGITGGVARSGKTEVVLDVRKDRRFLNRTGARAADEALSFICVPLMHLGQVIGTLSVDRSASDMASLAKDVALLEIIANITADAAAVCREECAERDALADENRRLRVRLGEGNGEMIGSSREMRAIFNQIAEVAPSSATVLIRGESGTGKELVAKAIQRASARKDRPFVIVNCAALPETLIESELFGHEKGAFTDAHARRIGRAEEADGGTLFLDEIGDLSVPTQVKLLRFLQERTFSRLGSNETIKSDVRFIAATSRNLEELMEKKLFREDLYYRLCVYPISVPPLSARGGDILLLAEHFMEKMSERYSKSVVRISPPAASMMLSYAWPGNVRELENCIERAVLTAKDDCIHSYNLPPNIQTPEFAEDPFAASPGLTLAGQVKAFERRILEETLARHGGNQSSAGRELGISPRMMNYKLNRLGIG